MVAVVPCPFPVVLVSDPRFHRRFIWLVLLGWLTQLFVPMAHAAAMAEHGSLHRGWCNTSIPSVGSTALAKKIAELPSEIRRIILKDATSTDDSAGCAQMCAATASGALPTPSAGLVLVDAAATTTPPETAITSHRSLAIPPPARGPPAATL
jgi:hypothetical protein